MSRLQARADAWGLANVVTLGRLALLPVVLALAWAGLRPQAAALAAVSLAADGLDGWLARRTGRITELGKILDPLADKLTVDGVLVFLAARGEFPPWALALVLVRDAAILSGAALLARRALRVPRAAVPGKVALVVLGAMAVAYLADLQALETPLLAAGTFAAAASGLWYALLLRHPDAGRARAGRSHAGRAAADGRRAL